MPDAKNLVLGIDVGGTKVLAGVVDARWTILGRGKVKSPFRGGPAEMTDALVAAADAALAEAGFDNIRVTVKAESREFIRDWMPGSGIEEYVASATIEATKPADARCCGPGCCG